MNITDITGVVSQTLETCPECSSSTTPTAQDAPAKTAPRRSIEVYSIVILFRNLAFTLPMACVSIV